mmetsp:Transcript_2878/g.7995  ORF Transcript_2878/g.7995 Transcript_2878/m.7995 type:complete len:91 (-) Transcript_2878:644-916(-)
MPLFAAGRRGRSSSAPRREMRLPSVRTLQMNLDFELLARELEIDRRPGGFGRHRDWEGKLCAPNVNSMEMDRVQQKGSVIHTECTWKHQA